MWKRFLVNILVLGFSVTASLNSFAAPDSFTRNDLLEARNHAVPSSTLHGVVSPQAIFVAMVFVWGADAIKLAKKLEYPGVDMLANPRFTVTLVGDLTTGTIFEVLAGGYAASSSAKGTEIIERFGVYLPDTLAEFGKGVPLRWETSFDPSRSHEAQSQVCCPGSIVTKGGII